MKEKEEKLMSTQGQLQTKDKSQIIFSIHLHS